jgi:hypothetical protein
VDAGLAVAGRDAAVVRLAGLEIADVLGLALQARGRVHVGQVVGQRSVEGDPVLLAHGFEAALVSGEDFGGLVRHVRRSP